VTSKKKKADKMRTTLTPAEISNALNSHNIPFTILKGNEKVGFYYDAFQDGTLIEFIPFKKLDTIKKLKVWLGY